MPWERRSLALLCVLGPHALPDWASRVLGQGLALWGDGHEAWDAGSHRLVEKSSQPPPAPGPEACLGGLKPQWPRGLL